MGRFPRAFWYVFPFITFVECHLIAPSTCIFFYQSFSAHVSSLYALELIYLPLVYVTSTLSTHQMNLYKPPLLIISFPCVYVLLCDSQFQTDGLYILLFQTHLSLSQTFLLYWYHGALVQYIFIIHIGIHLAPSDLCDFVQVFHFLWKYFLYYHYITVL